MLKRKIVKQSGVGTIVLLITLSLITVRVHDFWQNCIKVSFWPWAKSKGKNPALR